MAIRKNGQLTPKEQLFVVEYLKDFNGTQAAIRAGYSKNTAYHIGYENLKKPQIQTAISSSNKSLKNLTDKALMEAHEVEANLDAIIRFNIKDFVDGNGNPKPLHELTYEEITCIREFSIMETQIGTQRSIKFFNKLDAIKLKMLRLGMLKEKVEVSAPVETFEQIHKRLGLDRLSVKEAMHEVIVKALQRIKSEQAKKETEQANLTMQSR